MVFLLLSVFTINDQYIALNKKEALTVIAKLDSLEAQKKLVRLYKKQTWELIKNFNMCEVDRKELIEQNNKLTTKVQDLNKQLKQLRVYWLLSVVVLSGLAIGISAL